MLSFGYIESLNFYPGNSNISLMNVIDVSGQEQDYGVRAHIQSGSPTDRDSIPWLTSWPWASHLTNPFLSFSSHKMGIIIVPTRATLCEDFDVSFHRQRAVIIIPGAIIRKAKSQTDFYKISQVPISSCSSGDRLIERPTCLQREAHSRGRKEWGQRDVVQNFTGFGVLHLNEDKHKLQSLTHVHTTFLLFLIFFQDLRQVT